MMRGFEKGRGCDEWFSGKQVATGLSRAGLNGGIVIA